MSEEKKVLIVDDDSDVLEALQLSFEIAGYDTYATTRAEETYDLIDTFQPDILILDVLLSGKDGRTICRNIKTTISTQDLPIVMISAHPDARTTTIAAGADDFIAKPFEIDVLKETVEKYI